MTRTRRAQLRHFAGHVAALVAGAATPTLTRIGAVGLTHLHASDALALLDHEGAALALAALAWATPLTRAYGVGADDLDAPAGPTLVRFAGATLPVGIDPTVPCTPPAPAGPAEQPAEAPIAPSMSV